MSSSPPPAPGAAAAPAVTTPAERPLKVVIAGAGIAGNVLLRQLRRRPNVSVTAYEQRSYQDASPPGLNVLMNHNGLEAVREMDPDLYSKFVASGGDGAACPNWSARNVDGTILYHLPDVVASGEASVPALLARWDLIHAATRSDDLTEYNAQVVRVEQEEDAETVKVCLKRTSTGKNGDECKKEWILGVDLVVAADGRYSTIREQLVPASAYFGPPYVADFRIVAPFDNPDAILCGQPMWRVYNKPGAHLLDHEHAHVRAAASGYVRVGIMKLGPNSIGMFGNVPMLSEEKLHDVVKTAHMLVKLFTPYNDMGEAVEPDVCGQAVLDVLEKYGHEAHWARKQETETCYQALDGKVLFIGDAAGAIYPSLGQGANLSLEDACVTASVFPNVAKVAEIRTPRREFIKKMSRDHAEHVSGDVACFDKEIYNWREPTSEWRADLKRLWNGKQLALRAETATDDNVQPFGQLVAESLDGDVFGSADAQLDLSQGTPRLYLMKLTGGRPLFADKITCHKKVTQCLGPIGVSDDFYLVLHEAGETVTWGGLRVLRIPPKHFIKLNVGTWHAGPFWEGSDDARTFVNLELADTNQVDHTTVVFGDMFPGASRGGVVVPIHPVL